MWIVCFFSIDRIYKQNTSSDHKATKEG